MWKVLIAILLTSSPALSHEWYKTYKQFPGMASSSGCCGGTDCTQIPSDRVKFSADGSKTTIILQPGDHSFYPEGGVFETERQVQQSPDGNTHICLNTQHVVLCIFSGGSV